MYYVHDYKHVELTKQCIYIYYLQNVHIYINKYVYIYVCTIVYAHFVEFVCVCSCGHRIGGTSA